MTSASWESLLRDAQSRAQQLEKLHLTIAAFGVTVFTLAGSPILEGEVMTRDARWILVSVYLFALGSVVLLNWVARPFVVPAPDHDEPISYSGTDISLIEYCVKNTIDWNRVKRWTLASMSLAVASLIALIGDAETTGSSNNSTPAIFAYVFAAIVVATSLVAGAKAVKLIYCARKQNQTDLLRRRVLIDVDGYRPLDICVCSSGGTTHSRRSDDDAGTSRLDGSQST